MRLCFCCALLLVFATVAFGREQETPSNSLLNLVGSTTYTDAGLNQLTPVQQKILLEWILNHTESLEVAILEKAHSEFEQQEIENSRQREQDAQRKFGLFENVGSDVTSNIQSKIKGEFKGWESNTRFFLANGQIWQQRGGGSYYFPLASPDVVIERRVFGYWMTILETGASVPVKRVR